MAEIGIDRTEAYRQAGVDLDLSNEASAIAAKWAKTTWRNRRGEFGEPVEHGDDFSAARYLPLDEIRRRPDVVQMRETDGAGTKPDIYERMQDFRSLGRDLMAMGADDMPLKGGQGCSADNYLAVNNLKPENMYLIDQLFQGLAEAAAEANLALFTGEIAVHGERLRGPKDFTLDWSINVTGLAVLDRVITGANVKLGDELWGFAQKDGFRCNGISSAREAFTQEYGPNWHAAPFKNSTIGRYAMAPSVIYSDLMTQLTGGYKSEVEPLAKIHGAAHISGGSIPEKVGRMLRPTGLGANIDNPFEPPQIMRHAQKLLRVYKPDGSTRSMSDEEMYTTWHGGQGYVIAINEEDAETVRATAADVGIEAKRIGRIRKKPGISIRSRGIQSYGKTMEF